MKDEHYISGPVWQLRGIWRFWATSGGWPDAIGYGVTDDYGDIVRTAFRPGLELDGWPLIPGLDTFPDS